MFVSDETDDCCIDSIPNLPFNDNEEWETLPNSDEIPMDTSLNTSTNNKKRGLIESSTSLISSVTQYFKPYLGSSVKPGASSNS